MFDEDCAAAFSALFGAGAQELCVHQREAGLRGRKRGNAPLDSSHEVRRGIRRDRNPVIQSFAYDVMNYRGLGSGILRALKAWPQLEIVEDIEGEEVVITVRTATV